jgi:hypothetical protein
VIMKLDTNDIIHVPLSSTQPIAAITMPNIGETPVAGDRNGKRNATSPTNAVERFETPPDCQTAS